ncbi:FtsK/SpoIIIE domain-containing protein [Streptomyces sp. NPDC050619]|uniref:FtsK/SpoIIIE domain-containing protein n=1 Tax=Streptomyces sp. NPDC050619 TaxID=3157214 RepID=UPI00343A12E1
MDLQLSVVLDATRDLRADVLVDTDPHTSVGALATELTRLLGLPADAREPATLYVDGVRLDPASPLHGSPIRNGVIVSTAAHTVSARPAPQGIVEVRVAGGPDAGGIHRLGPGAAVVGSGPDACVRLADSALPAAAVRIDVAADGGVTVRAVPGSAVTLDGEPPRDGTEWRRGGLIAVGHSLLELRDPGLPNTGLRPSTDGMGLDYDRPPRVTPAPYRTRFQLPAEPRQAAAAGPFGLIGTYLRDHRPGATSPRRALDEYRRQKADIEQQARTAMAEETAARRHGGPDPAELLLAATGFGQRLWERRLTDGDHGLLRVGTGDLLSEVEITDPDHDPRQDPHEGQEGHTRAEPDRLKDVPVSLLLRKHGVLGVAGRGELPRAVGRWLVAQAAVLHRPSNLSVCVLTDPSGRECWEWVRWLPHARARAGQSAVALLGSDADSVARRINELLDTVIARQEASRAASLAAEGAWNGSSILVVLDGSRRLRRMPGLVHILREGPQVGVHLICLDMDRRLLPGECRALVEEDGQGLLQVSQLGGQPILSVRPDCVTADWCERLARAMAPVRDASEKESGGLPDACRLLDVMGLEPPSAAAITARWRAGGHSAVAVVGETFDGPFTIDLVRDGPHGLIAGTTGSGKSELLQTIVASLAVTNRPDAMNFVLVDYKGGAAFKDCLRLPHTVGMVTDLDPHLTERVLASLGAELRRRESLLSSVDTKDFAEYEDLARRDRSLPPLPRLLLVVDEFAAMARELPDFVTGLINIAQRGRSLGIHLILATQRPSGVVSPEIRANTNLRIALRVTDAGESQDVIDEVDAGYISKRTPGRAYARLGASSLLPFQAGRVGGRRPGVAATDPATPWAAPLTWEALGRPAPERHPPSTYADDDRTDLAVLVDAVTEAAAAEGFGEQHSPWLPALTDLVTIDELPAADPVRHQDVPPAVYGVTDAPRQQAHLPLTLDPGDGRHLLFLGGPRSGRSTALRTIAGALASTASPADLHLYAVDCGSKTLAHLESLPHCGAVVTRDEADRAARLLDRLRAEVSRRQRLLAVKGASSVAEQRASAPSPRERLPWMVLLLDSWDGFYEAFGPYHYGKLIDDMMWLLREGSSAGLKVVMTAGRAGLVGRVTALFEDRLILRTADPDDFALAGFRDVPAHMPPGRALWATDDGALESQIALLAPDPSGQVQAEAMRSLGREAERTHGPPPRDLAPMRVDALPLRATVREAYALAPDFVPPSRMWALLGVGGDELAPIGVDLAASGPGFVVAGPGGSGRSTTLLVAAHSLLRGDVPLVLITPKRSPLRELEGVPGVLGVLGADASGQRLLELLARAGRGGCTVLVDDADLLYDTALDTALEDILRGPHDGERAVLAAGTVDTMNSQYRGFLVAARRSHNGLLLSPQVSRLAGDLFGIRLPNNRQEAPIGRGLLIQADRFTPVQAVTEH